MGGWQYRLPIGCFSFLGFLASNVQRLVSCLNAEITFFQYPFPVISYKGKGRSRQFQGDGLHFSRLQRYLLKSSQATTVGGH